MKKFGELLLESIDSTVRLIFGESTSALIYTLTERQALLKREEIAEKPEVFSAGLEGLMVSAAPVIENLILKNLYSTLELEFEEKKGYEFHDYVKELSRRAVVEA